MRTETLVSEGLMKIPEACAFLACSRSKLYELVSDGVLQKLKIGRAVRLMRREVIAFAQSLAER